MKPKRVIAVGLSIGSGVAAELAAKRMLDGVILVTPFNSLKAVAQSMFPWLPIGPFFDHQIDAAAALAKVDAPVAIIAADRDEIVPAERTDALRKGVPEPGVRSNDRARRAQYIYARSDFHDAMHEALDPSQSVTSAPLACSQGSIHIVEIKGPIDGRDTLTDPQS